MTSKRTPICPHRYRLLLAAGRCPVLVGMASLLGCDDGVFVKKICDVAEFSVDQRTPPVSTGELWGVLGTFSPSEVDWTGFSADGSPSSTVAVVFTPDGSEPETVVNSGSTIPDLCRNGTALKMTATAGIDIGNGAVAASIPVTFWAFSTLPDDIELGGSGYDSGEFQPISVDPKWCDACASSPDGQWGAPIDDFYVGMGGTLAMPTLSIGGSNSTTIGVCWDGVLGSGAGDTGK